MKIEEVQIETERKISKFKENIEKIKGHSTYKENGIVGQTVSELETFFDDLKKMLSEVEDPGNIIELLENSNKQNNQELLKSFENLLDTKVTPIIQVNQNDTATPTEHNNTDDKNKIEEKEVIKPIEIKEKKPLLKRIVAAIKNE